MANDQPPDLKPPERYAAMRGSFHWLLSPEQDPWPALWKPESWWLILGMSSDKRAHRLAGEGWTYWKLCDPNDLDLDAEATVEAAGRAIADADGEDYMEDHARYDKRARAVCAKLKEMSR